MGRGGTKRGRERATRRSRVDDEFSLSFEQAHYELHPINSSTKENPSTYLKTYSLLKPTAALSNDHRLPNNSLSGRRRVLWDRTAPIGIDLLEVVRRELELVEDREDQRVEKFVALQIRSKNVSLKRVEQV